MCTTSIAMGQTNKTLPKPADIPSNSPKCAPIECRLDPLLASLRGVGGVDSESLDSPESNYPGSAGPSGPSHDEILGRFLYYEGGFYPEAPAFNKKLHKIRPEDPSHNRFKELGEANESSLEGTFDCSPCYAGIPESLASNKDIDLYKTGSEDPFDSLLDKLEGLLSSPLDWAASAPQA